MRIAVIGAGSIGLLWSSRLSRLPYEITVLTHTIEQHQQIVQAGISCVELDGQMNHTSVKSCPIGDTSELSSFDIIFITVKQYQLPNVMELVQRYSHPFTQILFWQNGLGHEEAIGELHHRPDTYVALTTEGAYRKSGTHVVHTGQGETWIGTFPHQEQWKPLLHDFIQTLQPIIVSPIREENMILKRMWEKLAVNAVINPLTTILEVPNGELLHGEFENMIEKITAETCQVARRVGVELDHSRTIKKIKEVCRLTSQNLSSMLQDVQGRKQTEIEAINGAILRYAKEHNIPVYYHEMLYTLVKAKEAQNKRNTSVL
ncbi:2-dehydropantoate 2-reductase [Croceifilum oryzae]|uniref:2-dehydropantoate 2-reductase n=1 Tax=Croceifilum oryzae TaxID=1553429 RepID=A0AAJ1TCP1_9BACL|nr:2-dehydropantoate 2-reductase [Croceifilum oryzae]MDQ0416373.1 2-dehydropantoate 2-reductase [Croceifilum oryzae]